MTLHDRYEKLQLLGQGPDCDVFRGRNVATQTVVTIKQLREETRRNQNRRERLYAEAVAAANQRHDHIVHVTDVDHQAGVIVSEPMASSAGELIQHGAATPDEAVAILRQCLSGIDHLHRQNLLHANLKPSNVMFDERRRLKLADGRYLRSDTHGTIPPPRGTHKYAAPEWIDDEFGEIGPGLDLYALGMVIVELLVGPKFDALFPIDLVDPDKGWIRWHTAINDPPLATASLIGPAPPRLAGILDRMIARPLRDRYTSVAELADDLTRWDETPAEATAVSPAAPPVPASSGAAPLPPSAPPRAPDPPSGARAAREHVQIKKPLEVDSLPARPSTPIVLRVASGPRAGEFVGVEGSEFAVGDDPSCELHLPAPSVGAPGVVVRLRRDAEGWKLATNQARVFVNGEAAKSTASIRSGDVIRLTPAGPDVQFLVQSQNQKTLEKLIATYWPKPAPRRGGGQRAAPRPAGPAPAPRAEVRPAPAPPSPRAAGGGNGASAPRPQPAGARPSAPSAAPQPPGPQRSSGRPAGLRQRWEEYYASNKDQANRWILVVGVVVIAVIVILLPSGEPDPAPQDPAEPAAVAGPDSAPPRPAADEDGQP